MKNNDFIQSLAGVVLAAGKGKRMNLPEANKVTMPLGEKPIIKHIVNFFQSFHIPTIIVVVGHAKETVMTVLDGETVQFVEQKELLGTGDALACAIKEIPENIKNVFVVYGDDGVIYTEKNREIMYKLFEAHAEHDSAVTFLTIEQDNPFGLGRIVRNNNGQVTAIVEEKDATDEEKNIKEINPGTFVFRVDFLKEYLPVVEKSPVTGEYYLTSLIDIALRHNKKIETVQAGRIAWRGVNTPEELEEANKLFSATID